jgi:L-asparaginase II
MHPSELTIRDVLRDPMVRQVLRADGISLPAFAMFLHQAARRQLELTSGSHSAPERCRPPIRFVAGHNLTEHLPISFEP